MNPMVRKGFRVKRFELISTFGFSVSENGNVNLSTPSLKISLYDLGMQCCFSSVRVGSFCSGNLTLLELEQCFKSGKWIKPP